MTILPYPLPLDQYFQQKFTKTQVVIHHTASGNYPKNVIDGWKADPYKVATAYVVDRDGKIWEAFDPAYWGSHVGYWINGVGGNDKAYALVPNSNNKSYNYGIETRTIGIEMCAWGNLTEMGGKYHTWSSRTSKPVTVDEKDVLHLEKPFRGFRHFQKYSEQQIAATGVLIQSLCEKFRIPALFDTTNFELNVNAITGKPGVYCHSNYRADKSDCFPQEELVKMLKQL